MNATNTSEVSAHTLQGIFYSRICGTLCGLALIGLGIARIFGEHATAPHVFMQASGITWIVLGALLAFPWKRIHEYNDKLWKRLYALLIFFAVAFVFTMIVKIMYDYMAADQLQQRLGVPGFEGTLIFVTLIQVPTILFVRKPTLLS